MNKIKSLFQKFMDMPLQRKIMLVSAVLLTAFVFTSIPVYAWFSSQKKAAEMYKVEYPNSLYINAAHREDQINFDLGEINMNEYRTNYLGEWLDSTGQPTIKDNADKVVNKRYVFSVSGSNMQSYTLQLAHTTNNEFTYTIYEASQYYYKQGTTAGSGIDSDDIVPSTVDKEDVIAYKLNPDSHTENPLTVIGDDVIGGEPEGVDTVYYVKGNTVSMTVKNDSNSDGKGDIYTYEDGVITTTLDKYFQKNYGTNTNIQANSVPLYSQAVCATSWDANKKFCNYYILEISWPHRTSAESKETDLVYLSVERKDG